MNEQLIDARGLACPEPVLRARRAMVEAEAGTASLVMLIDDAASAENIERMAATMGWTVSRQDRGGEFRLTLAKSASAQTPVREAVSAETGAECGPSVQTPVPVIAVFITSNLFGTGDEELGRVLMRSFVKTLKDVQPLPAVAIFANSGVRLTSAGSDLLDDLRLLASAGMRILSCGTCLDYYHLKSSLAVGQVTNMFEIASTLAAADRVLRP